MATRIFLKNQVPENNFGGASWMKEDILFKLICEDGRRNGAWRAKDGHQVILTAKTGETNDNTVLRYS